jgi:hypothetical protein
MRFIISVIDTQTRSPHSPDEIEAIDKFNLELEAKGYRRLAIGLENPKLAKVFDHRGENVSVTNGPLIDTTEFQSGIWIIDVPNVTIAEELAAQGSKACNRRVELRPIIG